MLDFLRLGTPHVLWGLGINQILMVVVFLAVLGWRFGWRLAKIFLITWILLVIWFGLGAPYLNQAITHSTTGHSSVLSHSLVTGRSLITDHAPINDHSLQSLEVGNKQLVVEVVNSLPSIVQGLSGRSQIGADGMLFLMPTREKTQFWMPDMEFDIDIIWIDRGKIIGITSDIPHPLPGTAREELELYPSPDKVEWVLEVAAGEAKKNGWQVNDMIKL